MTAQIPKQVIELLGAGEEVLNQWEASRYNVYATSKRVFFIYRQKIIQTELSTLSVKPVKRRLVVFFLLGLLLTYLGFFTSFGIFVGALGIICFVMFAVRRIREFEIAIPGQRSIAIAHNKKSEEIVKNLLEYKAKL